MPVLRERVETRLGPEEAFAFVADFANARLWDPGVASSARVDAGSTDQLAVGARFQLGVKMGGRVAPMQYRIVELERPSHVVLEGTGSGVDATDDITFTASPGGTTITYVADIRLRGLARLLTPLAGGAFRRVGERARDGMQRTLDERAARAH